MAVLKLASGVFFTDGMEYRKKSRFAMGVGRRAFKMLCLWDSWADLPEIRWNCYLQNSILLFGSLLVVSYTNPIRISLNQIKEFMGLFKWTQLDSEI